MVPTPQGVHTPEAKRSPATQSVTTAASTKVDEASSTNMTDTWPITIVAPTLVLFGIFNTYSFYQRQLFYITTFGQKEREHDRLRLSAGSHHAYNFKSPRLRTHTKFMFLPQAASLDKPGKPSAATVKKAAALSGKRKVEAGGASGKSGPFNRAERFVGDLKEGLYPGGCGIFRMPDDTLAFKENIDGVVSKKPVCGAPFREKCGGVSIYEWGTRVSFEKM
jgi:hypothetical protein